jgi:hypothetical protein
MPIYQAQVAAISNATANVEDTFIEVAFAAAAAGRIRRVLVSVETASQDCRSIVLFRRLSAAGAGGSAYTPTRADPQMRVPVSATNIKNAATAFSVGTAVDIPRRVNLNGRAIYEWVPRNSMEEIVAVGGNRFCVGIACSAVGIIHSVTCEWEE